MNNNTRILLGVLAMSLTANAAMKAGDKAPLFEAEASLAGDAFDYSLADALKKGTVVVDLESLGLYIGL